MTPPDPSQHPDWDDVDQASLDSFPASDPPAHGGARAAPSESTVAATAPCVAEAPRTRGRAIWIGVAALGVLGLLALGVVRYRTR